MLKHTAKIDYPLLLVVFFSFLAGFAPFITGQEFHLDQEVLNKAELKYGKDARRLLVDWQILIVENGGRTDLEKLERVNEFFNQMEFVDDLKHWGKNDYWATP